MKEKMYKENDLIKAFGRYLTDAGAVLATLNPVEETKSEPEILTGKWEVAENPFGGKTKAKQYKCNNCDKISRERSNFCPECGAKMEIGD